MLIVYGIKNCQSMKKCFDFLQEHAIVYQFFDYKKQTLSKEEWERFVLVFGMDVLINKKGTTYRQLDDTQKSIIHNQSIDDVYAIIEQKPTLLKRPIVYGMYNQKPVALIGFDVAQYTAVFV